MTIMPTVPAIPVPPLPPAPQAPPPHPNSLPIGAPQMVPPQQHHHQHQHHHVPSGGQQAPHGNAHHQTGFQGQHAQGGAQFGQGGGGVAQFGQQGGGQFGQGGGQFGQQGGGQFGQGQGQGNAQKPGGQNQQNQKTSFKYFQLRKPSSRDVEIGVRPSWAMSKATEVYITSAEIEEKVRQLRLKAKGSVSDEYDALPSTVKEKVDKLLSQHRKDEKDKNMLWNIAAIGVERRRIGFAGTELIQVKLFIKRSLSADSAGNKDKAPGGAQQGVGGAGGAGGMNQGGMPKQGGQMPMQNMHMQNPQMGNQQGGGFHGPPAPPHNMMPNMMHNMGPHMQQPHAGGHGHMQNPNVGVHLQYPNPNVALHAQHQNVPNHFTGGAVPSNIRVLDPRIDENFNKHSKHGKHGGKRHGRSRSRSKSKGKKDRRHQRDQEDDYDDYYEESDYSSRPSYSEGGNHSEEIDDLRDELKELKFDLRKEQRKNRPFNRRRWSASASQLPPVPMGAAYREPAHHDAQKVHMSRRRERKIHYHSPDESDGLTDRSGPSIVESWMTGSSGFSRPASDPAYSPPHSPGPRRSRDSLYYREHTKPARVGYHPEGRSSRLYLVEPDRRGSRTYLPNLVESRSSKVYLPLSGRSGSKVYLSDFAEKRSSKTYLPHLERRHTYDGDVGRKTHDAEYYIRSKERRHGRRDSWRRDEEDRYDDRYYDRYHR